MSELQLAHLMIRTGLERGVEIERVVAQLAAVQWPPFIDAGEFHHSLMQAAEDQLRQEFDARINRLRQQYGSGGGGEQLSQPAVAAAPVDSSPEPALQERATNAFATVEPVPDTGGLNLPSPPDGTMVWMTRDQLQDESDGKP